jgi:hypothetical protein
MACLSLEVHTMHLSNGFTVFRSSLVLVLICLLLTAFSAHAQVDPQHRSLLQFGYDQALKGQGPVGVYGFYYYNNPDFFATNVALRLAANPVYLDSEVGFRHLLSPSTDVGLGISGGGWGDDYYEVRQGKYIKSESFFGHGGTVDASIYQLLNPGMRVPLNFIARGGLHYSVYETANQTAHSFVLPDNQVDLFTRVGLRLAGKQPLLFPDLGMELSVWYEREWRLEDQYYGFDNDRRINPDAGLYWAKAAMTYSFTNTGQTVSAALTAGGTTDADRFSAWRLGGMLPLETEFPLMIPGYYNAELTARRFVHLYAWFEFPLVPSHFLKFRVEGAAANVEYLPGFEQGPWQTGAGGALVFEPQSQLFKIILRYGYGFQAIRDGKEGTQSVGVLFQYDLEKRWHKAE